MPCRSKLMRILYCNKYNFVFSGTEAYLFSAMEMMRGRGHETALFSMADPRGDPTPYDRYFVTHRDFQHTTGMFNRARLAANAIYSVEARRKLRAMIQDFRPDVAHLRNVYHHLSPSILWEFKAQGVPVVYHLNDFKLLCPSYNMVSQGQSCERCKGGKFANAVYESCYAGGRARSVVLALEAYIHRWLRTYDKCVDLFLAPSAFVKNKLIEHGWTEDRIVVLPHFQDASANPQPPGSTGTVLYFGRLSAEKGIEDLLQAAAELPYLDIVIAGDGPLKAELEACASTQGLHNARFVGHVTGTALQELIAQSRFTVFPSHAYETFGKSILESYAQARAVVASDLGSRRELVYHGQTGMLYRAGDSVQLAAAMRYLSAQPELSREMGNAGLTLVRDRYSPGRHCDTLIGIYESLAHEPKKIPSNLVAQPLRVAFIGGRGVIGKYSGVETFYEWVGQALAARAYEITAYCRTYFTPDQKEYARIRIVRLPTIRTKHLETFVHSLLSTVHACFSDYDIVHYHTLGPSLFSFLPRLFSKKTVVTVQGLDWQRKKWSWFARLVLKAAEWTSAHFPNRTIVVSHTLERYYRQRYGRTVSYIPNGSDLIHRTTGPHLAEFDLEPDNYVLFLGRFSPEKNLDLLIQAFEAVSTPMKLVLAGGSSHTDEYVHRLRSHASERIRFLDWLAGDPLKEVLTNAALFVLPSDMEGLSLALLDAMAAGLCVLASDIPENQEAIGDAGFTFAAGNAVDLQRMLTTLLSNAALRHKKGEQARERIRQHFLWSRVTDDLEQLYREVVGLSLRDAPTKALSKAA
jgi:glycosyltransferase involved in cell wall biosynthesis